MRTLGTLTCRLTGSGKWTVARLWVLRYAKYEMDENRQCRWISMAKWEQNHEYDNQNQKRSEETYDLTHARDEAVRVKELAEFMYASGSLYFGSRFSHSDIDLKQLVTCTSWFDQSGFYGNPLFPTTSNIVRYATKVSHSTLLLFKALIYR